MVDKKYVNDPKNKDIKLLIGGLGFNKYIERGYIYDEIRNEFIIPSRLGDRAFKNNSIDYDFNIVDKIDPAIQMEKLTPRAIFILARYLKQRKGLKFNMGMTIRF